MKKSLKKLYGREQNNLFSNGFILVSGRKTIFNGEWNFLVNTLGFSVKSFITYLQSMTLEKGSGGLFSNIYNGLHFFFFFFEFRSLSSNDDQSNQSEKYVEKILHALNLQI